MPQSTQCLDEAEKAYEQKDYAKALAALDQGLTTARSPGVDQHNLLSILDLQVATYLRLDKLDAANQSALSMIKSNKADGRGYLRCGQLQQRREDYTAANVWYERGLEHVAASDHLHSAILAQHEKNSAKLQLQAALSKPDDPFRVLPVDVLEMIIAFFSYREVVSLLRVSKGWQWILFNSHVLRNTIDFRLVGREKKVSSYAMESSLRRISDRPASILVGADLTHLAAEHLKSSLERWINFTGLHRFEIDLPCRRGSTYPSFASLPWHRYNLKSVNFGLRHSIHLNSVYRILQSCEALQKATFKSIEGPRQCEMEDSDSWKSNSSIVRPNMTALFMQGYLVLRLPVSGHTPL